MMLPLCSAAPTCSSYPQVPFHIATSALYPLRKAVEDRHVFEDKQLFCHATKYAHSLVVESPDRFGSSDSSIFSPYPNEFDDIVRGLPKDFFGVDNGMEGGCLSTTDVPGLLPVDIGLPETETSAELPSSAFIIGDRFPVVPQFLDQSANALSSASASSPALGSDATVSTPVQLSDAVELTNKAAANIKPDFENFVNRINESVDTLVSRVEGAVQSTYDELRLSLSAMVKSVTESADRASNGLLSSINNSKEQAISQLPGFSSELKENVFGAGSVAADVLRRTIISVENSLGNAAAFVLSSYGSAKSLLPPDIREVLSLSEEKATEILRPVGAGLQQVYVIIEGFEKNLGLDPTDPLVQFVLLVGSTATLGVSYWLLIYGGYSGDLTPEITLELLKNEKNAVLVDVRPEDLRERDGVPDLRRGARSKYASVVLPEINGSTRKLLKSGNDVDDSLLATVILNLKIVKDDTKVIVMDASGGRSKAIARSLRKLGAKNAYLVQGGFQSWVKKGLRIKELKPETTLTVLNEEAEALIENIKLTPELVLGYGLGISAFIYALIEWENTLQFIGIIGLGQTIYRRVASYEDSEDLKEDVRLLLAPVRLGAQAFSWAASKLEPNKIGLPTSPSSTAVHDRVVQAAAKHESQPPDAEQAQGPSLESLGQANEKLDLTEA